MAGWLLVIVWTSPLGAVFWWGETQRLLDLEQSKSCCCVPQMSRTFAWDGPDIHHSGALLPNVGSVEVSPELGLGRVDNLHLPRRGR